MSAARWRRATAFFAAALGVFVAVVATLSFALSLALPSRGKADWSERGVRLGMSEAQVRRSFVDADAGDWTRTTVCGGPSLEWTRMKPGVPTRWARFELHDGWLVAMRIHSDGHASSPRIEQAFFGVRRDRPFQGGVATTIIARGPPAYAAEVEQIARAASTGSPVARR
ncbi:MAG: hypothetical protein WBY94_04080 [Polyangiaceae bacterium]